MTALKVVVADDHPIFREGLRLLLESEDGIAVVAEAATTEDAVAAVVAERPDVVLLDVDMPSRGGLAVLPQLLEAAPGVAVVMLTMMGDDLTIASAVRAGARGYLLKGVGRDEVVAALRSVVAGGATYGPGVADRIVDRYLVGQSVAAPIFPQLTEREREVVALVSGGAANPEIARRLVLSPKTVRNLVSSAMAKLGARDRTALAVLVREAGMRPPEP
jgi:DNA-binding NarL/FixJ family response regulator